MREKLSRIFRGVEISGAVEDKAKAPSRNFSNVTVYAASSRRSSKSLSPSEIAGNHGEYAITPPDISAGFRNIIVGDKTSETFPSVNECIIHLKVLECFYRLRQSIGSTDGLFGICNSVVTDSPIWKEQEELDSASKTQKDKLLRQVSEKRWAIHVARAVDRFDVWVRAMIPNAKMASLNITPNDVESESLSERLSAGSPPFEFTRDNIPPIDVLMIWHAYMLNPRCYLEDCLRYGRMRLWNTPFPWQIAADCINSDTFAFEPNEGAKHLLNNITGFNHDAVVGTRPVSCPNCATRNEVPWTTCQNYPTLDVKTYDELNKIIHQMLSSGKGFCDKDLNQSCSFCKISITHSRLRARKFCKDIKNLCSDERVPMAGTVLGLEGIPWNFAETEETTTVWMTSFPNNLLLEGLGKKILDDPRERSGGIENMSTIRCLLEEGMRDARYMRKARRGLTTRLTKPKKLGIRCMMSRYWENSSPFALDLVGAVIRQGVFIEKMHNIDWLHSPALYSTIQRLLTKYERFVHIMKDRKNMAVPTLDVDLAWHTHQLNPSAYMKYTMENTGQFIDHDDKVAETKLNAAFVWTSKKYQRLYGSPYSECTCWYCEAVRERHSTFMSRLLNTPQNKASRSIATDDSPVLSDKFPHVSAHNAIRPTDSNKRYDIEARRRAKEIDEEWMKACGRAKKNGGSPPKFDDYYHSETWGYPVYIPAYSPFNGDMPYHAAYYPTTPGCMVIAQGAVRNCIKGTCGGTKPIS